MRPGDLFHTGIVVEEIEPAMEWFAAVVGHAWCEPIEADVVVELEDGEHSLTFEITYSRSEPRLELVRAIPATLWEASNLGVHHLGYWSDDIEDDLAHLAGAGARIDAVSRGPGGSALWAYCTTAAGTRLELVNRIQEPFMSAWFATGRIE
jgi:hypothetical protein